MKHIYPGDTEQSRMKRVVIVGPDFVPSSLPPALRVRFFAKHLPEFGWLPTVLSVDPAYYENAIDPENERLVPDSLEVIRTTAFPARYTRKFGLGDLGMRGLWQMWRALSRICAQGQVDLVFIPVPPYVPMVLGRWASRRFGIPYVIDYIDPWVTDYYRKIPKKDRPPKWFFADTLSRIVEPYSLRYASHLVGVSKGTTDGVLSRYRWLRVDGTEIPYGGEPDDFEYVRTHRRPNPIFDPGDGLLHWSSVGRGGVNLVPVLRALFQGVVAGMKRSPALFARLRIHFVGTSYAPDASGQYQVLPVAETYGLQGVVDEHPPRVPYLEALQILTESDGLIALGSEEAHYTASKIFPYILARKPILAVFHEASSVVEILRSTCSGETLTFGSGVAPLDLAVTISSRLESMLLNPSASSSNSLDGFGHCTTRAMTGRLAKVFDSVVGGGAEGVASEPVLQPETSDLPR